VNNAFFFVGRDFRLGFLSFTTARHIRNLSESRRAAVSVARSTQVWGRPIKGLQLFGDVREVDETHRQEFLTAYAARFPASRDYCHDLLQSPTRASARPYYFTIRSLKLIDEPRFGEETYVRAIIRRSRRSQ
jgi:hypothetical protein